MARWRLFLAVSGLGLVVGCGSVVPGTFAVQADPNAPMVPNIGGPTPGLSDQPPIIKLPGMTSITDPMTGQTIPLTPTTSTTSTVPTTSTTGTTPTTTTTEPVVPPLEGPSPGLPALPPTEKKEEVLMSVPKAAAKYARIYQDAIFRDMSPQAAMEAAKAAATKDGVDFEAQLKAVNADFAEQLTKAKQPNAKLRFVLGQ